MAVELDIGAILFRDILKITQYPGAPFTGNIINDIILYFFIPMVFMIFFIYLLLGRIVASVRWLRLLMGIALFLFMVVNGWFAIFALMAGPYFIFLILVLGALYFLPAHFRIERGRPTGLLGGTLIGERRELERKLRDLKEDLERAERRRREAQEKGIAQEAEFWAREGERIRKEIRRLEEELKIIHV